MSDDPVGPGPGAGPGDEAGDLAGDPAAVEGQPVPEDPAAAEPAPAQPASDEPGAQEPDVRVQPRLVKPRVFREAQERRREREAWEAMPEEERQQLIQLQARRELDARYVKARTRLLALVDDGRFAQGLLAAERYMSRRGMRRLTKLAEGPPELKSTRTALWLLSILACAAAEVRAGGGGDADDPEPQRPRVRVSAGDGRQKPAARGVLRVKTQFAREGDKC